jgi:hypothetical protein
VTGPPPAGIRAPDARAAGPRGLGHRPGAAGAPGASASHAPKYRARPVRRNRPAQGRGRWPLRARNAPGSHPPPGPRPVARRGVCAEVSARPSRRMAVRRSPALAFGRSASRCRADRRGARSSTDRRASGERCKRRRESGRPLSVLAALGRTESAGTRRAHDGSRASDRSALRGAQRAAGRAFWRPGRKLPCCVRRRALPAATGRTSHRSHLVGLERSRVGG